MPLPTINPTTTAAWQLLSEHYNKVKDADIKTLFGNDDDRAAKFTIEWQDFLVDYSKNRLDETTVKLLLQLAKEVKLDEAIKQYYSGQRINQTEGRAVLHTALRAKESDKVELDGVDVISDVYKVKKKVKSFSDSVIAGERTGHTGKAFTDVVNIGIGGSDLGPAMVTDALKHYKNHLEVHYVNNVDGDHVQEVIKDLNPETTLFVIVSKTFTTQETLSNANTIKKWFLQTATQEDITKHFAAVSTNVESCTSFGISPDNIFPMWNWVGGRFSLWSAVGISISLAVGFDRFDKLLKGANEMDEHFRNESFENNIPVILGMLTIWYNNFYGAETEVVIPYTQYLSRFSAYLQQGLIALYEHKIFVQGVIWNIFSYDQWGVELGKQLGKVVLNDIESGNIGAHDGSTTQLLKSFLS